MDMLQLRILRLYGRTEEPSKLADQVADLRHTLLSLIQETEVLKAILRERGDWNEEAYRRLRIERMLADHDSAGASPWRHQSSYRYTLDEDDFLREQFRFGDADVADFRDRARSMASRT
jgi:hypothetical protein